MESYDPAWLQAPRGLANHGNECHFNSLLQALLSCPAFVKTVSGMAPETRTARALRRFVLGYDSGVLDALVADLRERRPAIRFSTDTQECVAEGLVLLLDMVSARPEGCPVRRLFEHRTETVTVCSGGCRPVPVPDVAVHFLLHPGEENFSLVLRRSPLEGHRCACGRPCRERVTRLRMAPEILVCIWLPAKLQPKFPARLEFPGRLSYVQVAQVEHGGNHYVARGRRTTGDFLFNDACFFPARLGAAAGACMAVYHFLKSPETTSA